jgi:DNA-directed RNA polymerase subunit RPC12/RpoP
MKNVFTKANVMKIEAHIHKSKERAALLMADHNNEETTDRFYYTCSICNNKVYANINRDQPIDYMEIACPYCKDELDAAVLNMREN